MKLTPTPHPLSAQGKFEAHCLSRGAKRGVLAIASESAYASPCIQAAWLLWLDFWRCGPFESTEPFEGSEPFQSEEPFSSGEFQVSDSLAQHSVVYDEEE